MPADELAILGECDVALDDPGAHTRARFVGFPRVFGKLQWRAAVCDREIRAAERAATALLEPRLERAIVHAIDQVERALAQLDDVGIAAGFICRQGGRRE